MSRILSMMTSILLFTHISEEVFCQEQDTADESCLPAYRFNGEKLALTREEWKKRLSPEAFKVLREAATEPAYKNAYNDNKEPGIYACAGCGLPLYSSQAKYDSKTGWPSFTQPICKQNVSYREDRYLIFLTRTEVICSRCEGHLGHVFDDGPPPTGKRYCMNSAALTFIPQ